MSVRTNFLNPSIPGIQTGLLALTIANNGTLSGVGDLGGMVPIGLFVDGWTAADMSFDVSFDGSNFVPLYQVASDGTLTEVKLTTPVASRYYAFDPTVFLGVVQIKVRSGLNGVTVNQGAARAISLICRNMDN